MSSSSSLPPQQRQKAVVLLDTLLGHYGPGQRRPQRYKPAVLVQQMYKRVASQDAFLAFFFLYIYEDLAGAATVWSAVSTDIPSALAYAEDLVGNPNKRTEARKAVERFSEHIVEDFLLPLRLSAAMTPKERPTAWCSAQAPAPGDPRQSASVLRENCLMRDGHRCVISGYFDEKEAARRLRRRLDPKDDDGHPLKDEASRGFEALEVAHILPLSLRTPSPGETDLSESKKNVSGILEMFDPGISHHLNAYNINGPENALTMTRDLRRLFNEFQICFEATGMPHQYRIDLLKEPHLPRNPIFPVTRTLRPSPGSNIAPPDPRFLGVHCAIAHIMGQSGAGKYIDRTLRDILGEVDVKEDGSTDLGRILGLRLNGWIDRLTG